MKFLVYKLQHLLCQRCDIFQQLIQRTTWLRGTDAMYSRLTSVSTQLGGRPTIVVSGNVSSTWQHSIMGSPLNKKSS